MCLDFVRNQKKDIRILDAGCGDGRFLGYLQELDFTHLTGTDYSERALYFARLFLPGATLEHADLTVSLPFADETFDAIFLIETLEHIKPELVSRVIQNLSRILKPQGTFIISVPSTNQSTTPGHKHYQHFSPQSLQEELRPFFARLELKGQDKIGFHPWKLFFRLLDNRFWKIKSWTDWYNTVVWPKVFNECQAHEGRRLIGFCTK